MAEDRRRKKNPKKHQICLRLNDEQLELLQEYAEVRELKNEVDALRYMIDGLGSWLAKRKASTQQPLSAQRIDVPPKPESINTEASDAVNDEESDEGASLGEFGGRVNVGLPGIPQED